MNGTALMRDIQLFIGGWSLPPTLFLKCFGSEFTYIDCNLIVPELFDRQYNLDKNWPLLLKNQLLLSSNKRYHLAGWSTGAIMAFALAAIHPVSSLTLISPTLSFCRKDGYRAGAHPRVLRTMREHLRSDPDNVLSKFHKSCGFKSTTYSSTPYTIEQLTCGLHFLEQADCTKITPALTNVFLIHGSDDTIIPLKAAEMVAERCGSTLHVLTGSHAVFHENEPLIAKYINEHTTKGNSHEHFRKSSTAF